MLELAESIRSRERIQAIQDRMVSSGWAKKGTVSRHMRGLESRSNRVSLKTGKPSQQAIDASLHRAGIQVVRANG